MAKTLIGNIKGQNGRGITSIKKTDTDGSIDTYTITYTDNTTSTFTVNNSDNVLLQRQIVPSAAVEPSSTASQAYAAGDYVVVNGVLRKVKTAIAKGNIIGDSNSTAATVTGELANLGDSVSHLICDISGNAKNTASITFSTRGRAVGLVMMDSNGKGKSCLYFVSGYAKTAYLIAGVENTPTWSTDGRTITFQSTDWNKVTVITADYATLSFA